jgi:type VI secretion system FHA domain protein
VAPRADRGAAQLATPLAAPLAAPLANPVATPLTAPLAAPRPVAPPPLHAQQAAPPSPAAAPWPSAGHPAGADELDALRQAFLRGAGLDTGHSAPSITLNPRWMEHLGAVLRTATEGTLALLQSRAVTKRSIRAEGTRIAARKNNPLKFAPDTSEALVHLLNMQASRGFLGPIDALHDAHDDLQVHQLAMVAGMQAAVFELISRLGPAATEAAEGAPRGLARHLPAWRDAALWRRHCQGHAHLLAHLDDDFEAIFGREFLRAYEEQSRLAAVAAAAVGAASASAAEAGTPVSGPQPHR